MSNFLHASCDIARATKRAHGSVGGVERQREVREMAENKEIHLRCPSKRVLCVGGYLAAAS